MANAFILMENDEGKLRKAPIGFSWPALAIGFLLPLSRGQWGEFGRAVALTICTIGLYWLIQPFHANQRYRSYLYQRGYRAVEIEGLSVAAFERHLGLELRGLNDTKPTSLVVGEIQSSADTVSFFNILKKYGGWIFVMAFIGFLFALGSWNDARLKQLRIENPAAYLKEIKDQPNFMVELKALDPEEYQKVLDTEWLRLFSAGRENASKYVDDFLNVLIVPEEKLIAAIQDNRISGREFNRLIEQNDRIRRTIPYAQRQIEDGDLDTIIERGMIFRISRDCGDEPGYENWDATLSSEATETWHLIEEADRKIRALDLSPFAQSAFAGTFIPKKLPRDYLADPNDIEASCAQLRYVVTRNRFYNAWNVERPEELENNY